MSQCRTEERMSDTMYGGRKAQQHKRKTCKILLLVEVLFQVTGEFALEV